MLGDHMLFMREDSVELAWSVLTPALEAFGSGKGAAFAMYAAGADGPDQAQRLIRKDGRTWRSL
jgi:glucose-6-phosphate 1-dehydrogenase